MLNCNRFRMWI